MEWRAFKCRSNKILGMQRHYLLIPIVGTECIILIHQYTELIRKHAYIWGIEVRFWVLMRNEYRTKIRGTNVLL